MGPHAAAPYAPLSPRYTLRSGLSAGHSDLEDGCCTSHSVSPSAVWPRSCGDFALSCVRKGWGCWGAFVCVGGLRLRLCVMSVAFWVKAEGLRKRALPPTPPSSQRLRLTDADACAGEVFTQGVPSMLLYTFPQPVFSSLRCRSTGGLDPRAFHSDPLVLSLRPTILRGTFGAPCPPVGFTLHPKHPTYDLLLPFRLLLPLPPPPLSLSCCACVRLLGPASTSPCASGSGGGGGGGGCLLRVDKARYEL